MDTSRELEPGFITRRKDATQNIGTQWISSLFLVGIAVSVLHVMECRKVARETELPINQPASGFAMPVSSVRETLSSFDA